MTPDTAIIGASESKGADLVPLPSTPALPTPSAPLPAQVREFVRASKAENTLRGYQSDWRDFCSWCEMRGGLSPLPAPAGAVATYIAECAGHLKPGSIQRRLNAIAEAHKAAGLDSPTHAAIVRNTLKGIRRTLGTTAAQKAPTLTDDIRAMVDATDPGIIGVRDRALILLGFAGAFRRPELVGLNIEGCAFGKDGLIVTLRRSKTDQDGLGRKIGIPYGSNPETGPVATSRNGSHRQASAQVRFPCSAQSIAMGMCKPVAWPVSMWRAWSRSWRTGRDWTRASTRGIPSGRGTLPVQRSRARRNGPS